MQLAFVLAFVALVSGPGSLRAATLTPFVLDFSGGACGGPPCGNSDQILQSYGRLPGLLAVTSASVSVTGDEEPLKYWETQYSDLAGVAFADGANKIGHIELRSISGDAVTLDSFRLGAFRRDRETVYRVIDLADGSALASSGPVTIAFDGALLVSGGGVWSSMTGLRIEWGTTAYNVAIDDVVGSVAGLAAVPAPPPAGLLAGGLMALAWRRRRR